MEGRRCAARCLCQDTDLHHHTHTASLCQDRSQDDREPRAPPGAGDGGLICERFPAIMDAVQNILRCSIQGE